MNCNRCGAPMTANLFTETSYKEGHGCLFTILFGIFYWAWLLIKWTFKLIIALYWYMIAFAIAIFYYPIKLARGQRVDSSFWNPPWLRKMMRRKGRLYYDNRIIWVCQNCGNTHKS